MISLSNLTLKQKVGGVVVYTLLCVSVGRYTVATSIKTEKTQAKTDTSVVTDDSKKKQDTTKDKHEKTVIVEIDKPDGTRKKTTIITQDDSYQNKVTHDVVTTDDTKKTDDTKDTKTVTTDARTLHVYALAGMNISNPSQGVIYGAHVSKEIFGPASIGLFGLSNGTCGGSIGLSF